MNPLKSVGGRLSIALVLVVAVALGVAYLVVVPRLENRLVDARLSQVTNDAQTVVDQVANKETQQSQSGTLGEPDWSDFIPTLGQALNVHVVMYRPTGTHLEVLAASPPEAAHDRPGPVISRMYQTGALANGTVTRDGQRYAEVAIPGPPNVFSSVFLVSVPLQDTLRTVGVIKRRLLYAGLIALAIALAVGFVAARMFARRIKRLERAADWIAAGHFDDPVVDTGQDELGQLAMAFDRMRQRLAHLEHARREFIANASHELRTPLFALAGLLELLDDEELDEHTRQEFLSTAREQSDRLTRLATDLLDLNRLDAGRLHVERETVELDEIAEVLSDEFRAVASANEHPLEVLGSPTAAAADEQRVLQIGRVLVDNAILHTPSGTPIRVRTATSDGRALLAVEDDGPGISSEHVKHVFERFYRVNGAVTSGSGLGLAIAHELAELMGGEIQLESRPGRTVFTLSLPLATVATATSLA